MEPSDIVSIIIASVALIISAVSLFMTIKTQRIQNKVNKYTLEEQQENQIKKQHSDIDVYIEKEPDRNYKLIICNNGGKVANNVDYKISYEKFHVISYKDQNKFPINIEPNKNVRENLGISMSSSRKFEVELSWQEENGEEKKCVKEVSF